MKYHFENDIFFDIIITMCEVIMKYKIIDEEDKVRIDKYLIDKLSLSRSKTQEMIKENLVLVNDKNVKKNYVLRLNDEITIVGELNIQTDVRKENIKLDIVYEDDYLMVINKPSGMVVHPGSGNYSGTLVNALMYYTNSLSTSNGSLRPGIVHRIDKDTSGLLVVAKDDKMHELLSNQLKDKTLYRKYVALVEGRINHDTGIIDAPIGRDKNDRKKMCVTSENSKEAITEFKILERYKDSSLVECTLKTGRTHQIRVHMAYINHPIVNDPVYNKKKATSFGQMLHAKQIGFIHPVINKYMEFSVNTPKEFDEVLEIYKNK